MSEENIQPAKASKGRFVCRTCGLEDTYTRCDVCGRMSEYVQPTDAEVREAVGWLEASCEVAGMTEAGVYRPMTISGQDARTLLSYVRAVRHGQNTLKGGCRYHGVYIEGCSDCGAAKAVQSPRLTGERLDAVRELLAFIHAKECETDGPVRLTLGVLLPFIFKLRATFPELKEGGE